jgi:hypothetical protein
MRVSITVVEGMRMLVFDNEVFDWGFTEDDLKAARLISNNDPTVKVNYIAEIQKHFLSSLSEMIGRSITFAELNKAIREGIDS